MKGFLAAVMMLTRLPLWRVVTIDKHYFSDILKYWPLVGYLTGFTTVATLWAATQFMPALPACILAVIARLLLTGAMHEDGLADFIDGFGGGNGKERILAIMKDSHIGSYGTIGLIVYFILYTSFLYSLDFPDAFLLIPAADIFSKLCTSLMINTLPYVRKEEESKTKVVYRPASLASYWLILLLSLLPWIFIRDSYYLAALIPPIGCSFLLRNYLKRKIGGYTGDCCGAAVLITEQMCYLGIIIVYCR